MTRGHTHADLSSGKARPVFPDVLQQVAPTEEPETEDGALSPECAAHCPCDRGEEALSP